MILSMNIGSKIRRKITANPTTGQLPRNWVDHEIPTQIENIRGKEDRFTLDNTGFQFARQAATHTRFTDDAEIETEYNPESIEIIKKMTGASSVVIFDHNAPALLKRRFQIVNIWRPIPHAALDWPLALCDFRSIDVGNDLVPVALVYPDREGETYGVRYNPCHEWKYLRGMEPDELVLIKCFDSVQDGSVATLTPHTGFQDPTTPEGAPLRESIELRALVFYD
ncbi:hypothetical protein BV22DRAFT_1106300 [Leucogyrophana mollusca]|uniref:Uncharacterized protein n=1 Tax=Leucogyrophana mollusca TaxID=85980 RepID=A0ACB8BCT8_9AGAM|nr:hypothetical protein BV22DRAFT_1106300 [Leucogyrophana mollusca]